MVKFIAHRLFYIVQKLAEIMTLNHDLVIFGVCVKLCKIFMCNKH